MNPRRDPRAVPTRTRAPRHAYRPDTSHVYQAPLTTRFRSVLTVAAGLAISAAWGQGVSTAATERPLLVSSLILPTHIAAVEVDNSHADSWLEVDRTANTQTGAGDAGSDHEGGDD